jgi:hypothetical protein
MENYEKLEKFMNAPIYERFKPNEIIRPVMVGMYLFTIAVTCVYLIVSLIS